MFETAVKDNNLPSIPALASTYTIFPVIKLFDLIQF